MNEDSFEQDLINRGFKILVLMDQPIAIVESFDGKLAIISKGKQKGKLQAMIRGKVMMRSIADMLLDLKDDTKNN